MAFQLGRSPAVVAGEITALREYVVAVVDTVAPAGDELGAFEKGFSLHRSGGGGQGDDVAGDERARPECRLPFQS